MLAWPLERAAEVLEAWREWTEALPDETTSLGRLLQLPPIPDIPEPLRGRSFVVVESVHLGEEAVGAEQLAPLRALGPEFDTFAMIPATGLHKLHMDPEHPVPGAGDGMLLSELTPEAVETLVSVAGPGTGSPLLSLEVRHLGGAIARPGGGALDSIDAGFALYGVGIAMSPETAVAIHERLDAVRAAMSRWDAGRGYLNFVERPTDSARLFPADAHRRLRQVKAAYDPSGMFRANHPIG